MLSPLHTQPCVWCCCVGILDVGVVVGVMFCLELRLEHWSVCCTNLRCLIRDCGGYHRKHVVGG